MNNDQNNSGGVKICHLNCRGITPKIKELAQWIQENEIDIALFSETILKSTQPCQLPGYSLVRFDLPQAKRGLLLAHSPRVKVTEVALHTDGISHEALSCSVDPCDRDSPSFRLSLVYRSPAPDRLDLDFLRPLFANRFSLVLGDLNARHKSLGCESRDNRAGKQLHEWLCSDEPTPTIVNERGEFTRIANKGGVVSRNVLDLALATEAICPLISDFSVGQDLDSDHLPIILTLRTNTPFLTDQEAPRNYSKANWEAFQIHIRQTLLDPWAKPLKTPEDIDGEAAHLTAAIHAAIDHAVPLRKRVSPLPQKIISKIKERRKLRRLHHTTREDQYRRLANRLAKEIRRDIDLFNKQKYTKMCNTLAEKVEHQEIKNFWRDVKTLMGQKKGVNIPTLTSGPIVAHTDLDKADLLADSLDAKMRPVLSSDDGFRREVERVAQLPIFYPTPPNRSEPIVPLEKDFTVQDVVWELEHLRLDSAPGLDKIPNTALKLGLEYVSVTRLTNLINACFEQGYFPKIWKTAVVVMLPKPDKPPDSPSSYRPISLTSCLGKVLEKLIVRRLKQHLESTGVLGEDQCAYRKTHSTYDNLCRLVQDVMVAKQSKKKIAAVLLDVDGAFDKVWHDLLRYLMFLAGFPGKIMRICSNYLDDRQIQVRVNSILSHAFRLQAGVPQGGIISPLLYLLYVSTMPKPESPGVRRSQFADDMAIWASADGSASLGNILQRYLDRVHEWCNKQGIKINATKSQAIAFNIRSTKTGADMRPQLRLGTTIIPYYDVVRFLGIKLDTSLRLTEHVKSQVNNCRGQIMHLNRIAKKTRLSDETLKMLYRVYIESTMTYGAPILTILPKSSIHDLQKIQNLGLRICFGIPFYISTKYLHEHARMPMVEDRIWDLGLRWFLKVSKAKLHDFDKVPPPLMRAVGSRPPVIHGLRDALKARLARQAAAAAAPTGVG